MVEAYLKTINNTRKELKEILRKKNLYYVIFTLRIRTSKIKRFKQMQGYDELKKLTDECTIAAFQAVLNEIKNEGYVNVSQVNGAIQNRIDDLKKEESNET